VFHEHHTIKPLATLTAAVCTTLMLACNPTQQTGTTDAVETAQPAAHTIEITNENRLAAAKDDTASVKSSEPDRLAMKREQPPATYADKPAMEQAALYGNNSAGAVLQSIRPDSEELDRENYAHFDDAGVRRVAENPVSTFSIDVDTGAYSNVRRMLNTGRLPTRDAVRVEELINYFSYDYPAPKSSRLPFAVYTEVGPAPWNTNSHLLHIGIRGFDAAREQLPPSNLVFLVDVSGSMQSPDKLGLLKSALKLLTKQLRENDKISIVVYAGASGVVLEPTGGNEHAKISAALDALTAGGSTNGAAGIRLAYSIAEQAYIEGGINRVLLATDGDFNVGTVSFEALKDMVEEKRGSGISLTTLGFGSGNYNDQLMDQLADAGNGNYAYIDTLNEAQKVLVDEMSSTLNTIAKDVKIQLEFNPAVVAEYRLIGYENRTLKREDFNNDKVDAGEIGAGHTVTALYEITLNASGGKRIDALRYADKRATRTQHRDEIALLRLRYKQPDGHHDNDTSELIESTIKLSDIKSKLTDTGENYRFAASVAAFGQLLRGGRYTENFGYDAALELARNARGKDPFGYRGEFLSLLNLAKSLSASREPDVQALR